jgi:hypothetical protein
MKGSIKENINNHMFYAGIGSRETPTPILKKMRELAAYLEQLGFVLRSGNAVGADTAFAEGTSHSGQVWLPWADFNLDTQKKLNWIDYRVISDDDVDAYSSITKFHRKPQNRSDMFYKLMARNYRQIVGLNESNSQFVICWTRDGKDSGGTGQALRIASFLDIPIYNLYTLSTEKIKAFIALELFFHQREKKTCTS